MKNNFIVLLLLPLYVLLSEKLVDFTLGSSGNPGMRDTVALPPCIQQLSRFGAKSPCGYRGAEIYVKQHVLSNGRTLFVFMKGESFGCLDNEPAGWKYYNDSCNLVAKFPAEFSMQLAFRPFIAKGYVAADFPDSKKGEYPAYFDSLQKAGSSSLQRGAFMDPFPVEKSFSLENKISALLDFKKGDVIKIQTKKGLSHFRNNKLLNQYKIVPQQAIITQRIVCARAPCPPIVTKKLVYFLGAAECFIDIRLNALMVSKIKTKDANSPTTPLETEWTRTFDLKTVNKP